MRRSRPWVWGDSIAARSQICLNPVWRVREPEAKPRTGAHPASEAARPNRRKKCSFAARMYLGASPQDPRWGSAPDPVGDFRPRTPPERGLGRRPNGVWGDPSGGLGAESPATFLRRIRPWVWGKAPNDSIKPTGLVSQRGAKFVCIQFGGWALRARVASPNGPRLSAAKPQDRSPPSQTGFRQIWRRSGETKPVA